MAERVQTAAHLPRHLLFGVLAYRIQADRLGDDDDGGYSGGSIDRPALQQLLADVKAHKVNVIIGTNQAHDRTPQVWADPLRSGGDDQPTSR
jgi:hypothetical protein